MFRCTILLTVTIPTTSYQNAAVATIESASEIPIVVADNGVCLQRQQSQQQQLVYTLTEINRSTPISTPTVSAGTRQNLGACGRPLPSEFAAVAASAERTSAHR